MAKIDSPASFSKKIGEALGTSEKWVGEWFEIEEDKKGYFAAKLKAKRFLDKAQFKTMCALTRDLGGEAYLAGSSTWKVAGAYAKKGAVGEEGRIPPSQPAQKPAQEKAAKAPQDGQNRDVEYTKIPLNALLSMPFQSRTTDDAQITELAENIKQYGVLEPILVREKPSGMYEIVAGERRAKAAEKAGLTTIPVLVVQLADDQAFLVQLIENIHRKDLAEGEKSRALGELARRTGWNAQQIADRLKMSYRWVCLYLPAEFKDEGMAELGVLSSESRKEQKSHVAASLAANTESHEARQGIPPSHSVPCARCGDPTSELVHLSGKFYCGDCAEQAVAEARHGAGPSLEEEEGDSETLHGKEPAEPKPEAVDIGEFECPECQQQFIVEHVSRNVHRLRVVKKL